MTMRLTKRTGETRATHFEDIGWGECFTMHRGQGPTVYQKMETPGVRNAVAIACGSTVLFKPGLAIYRVNVTAEWEWPD